GRQPERLEALDFEWDSAEDGANGAFLSEDVGAEAAEIPDAEGEVDLPLLLVHMFLGIGHDAVGEPLRVGRGQRRTLERRELPVHADLRRRPDRQVQVGAARLDQLVQHLGKCVHIERGSYPFTVSRETSSSVVKPALILASPLWRSVSIPSSTALRLISRADPP